MKAVVVQFPGSNADWDAMRALRDVVQIPTEFVFHKQPTLPPGVDLVVLPGGFAHGDYLRCGAIARFSPIMADVRRHAERGGFLLGICNGFQVLTEAELLPGALTRNAHLRFECRDVRVRVESEGAFTAGLLGEELRIPIAHAEGRYQADEPTLAALERDKRVAFRYAGDNPNGSLHDIAGLYGGPRRNVLGLMPHPERACEPALGSADGRKLLTAITRAVLAR
jgi:phosphoribosylformylglycinamidine synthase I